MSARAGARGRRTPGRSGGLVLAALASVWLLVPLVPLLVWAFADRWSAPAALPQVWGLQAWREVSTGGLGSAFLRSCLLGLTVAAIATPLGAMAGRAIGWRETRRPGLVAVILLLPVLLPPFAVAMGLDVLALRLRIPGPVAVVAVLVVFALPYCAYTMAAGYAALDPGIEEQARSLGADPRLARRRATLPALTGSLTVAAVLAFLVGWSDYVVILLLGGGQWVTVPILLGATASGSGNEPAVAVLAIASALPPVLLVAVVSGVAMAARRRLRASPDAPVGSRVAQP